MKPAIDLWANFLANEKLVSSRIEPEDTLELIKLCAALAGIRGPRIGTHKDKLLSRELVCHTAMVLGIDLPSFTNSRGKRIIGRGLLDAWNKAQVERYGSAIGTAALKEAKRRDIKTLLADRWHE